MNEASRYVFQDASKATYVVEEGGHFEEDIVLTPQHVLDIWDETMVRIRSGELSRSYLESKEMEKALNETSAFSSVEHNVTIIREKDKVRERESEREREREREREILLRSIVNMMIHVQIKITMWIDPRRPALRPWRSLAHRPP